jgi:hypothetical protein
MPDTLLIAVVFLVFVAAGAAINGPLVARRGRRPPTAYAEVGASAMAIGTVRTVSDRIMIDVESVSGQRFVGRLRRRATDDLATDLRPGVVLLVAFDPQARDTVALADDMVAVRSAFDRMLVRKGLVTADQLDLIRHGTRSRGVVTGMRATGEAREDYREVELHLMVRRPEGGQFPAHEKTLVRASALAEVAPGSVVDAYYRRGDETAVAVCVAPS